jgi:enediyne biosynthesis protein E4
MKHLFTTISLLFLLGLSGCNSHTPQQPPLFEILDQDKTGIDFNNKLTPTQQFNVFKYMYYFNGAGLGAGDFNNDGKIDLFFAANEGDDKLYLNQGGLKFKDVTAEAKIPEDGGWSTGVSVVDINNDGLLDIYICRVGNHETLHSHNQLLICQGIDNNGVPFYKDEAKEYGLDFSGFSTQAVFFDYDGDGDLDMYLLNHLPHQNGTYHPREEMLHTSTPLSGDRLYRNDGNKFTDITKESGINSSAQGYGLGIVASDINLDGYPDLYIGNDFHENDYLYINQKNGTFKDEIDAHLMHTSKFSMGVDAADINNDAFPDLMTVDMLPYDPTMLKTSDGDNTYDIFKLRLQLGYNYQYSRNNLQLNRRNGLFSEVGLYAGIAATDWSWSPLWFDFDNDGLKDLFISSGIPRRLNDIDYINFLSNRELQEKMQSGSQDQQDLDIIEKSPQIKIPSKFFQNNGDLQFTDLHDRIGNVKSAYSDGAIYADLDNDGDLDIVVNNIDEPAMLYANRNNDKKDKPFTEIKLKGAPKNINAIGAKVIVFTNGSIRAYEKYPVRGFMSSAETPIHIGLNKTTVDSAFLVWPDNTFQSIRLDSAHPWMSFTWQPGLPKFDYGIITHHWVNPTRPMKNITAETNLLYKHQENEFNEFNREPLLPHMLSTEGPALAVGDLNRDGLDDVFIGSARNTSSVIFLQDKSGKFIKTSQPDLEKDSAEEAVDACFADVNHDGNPDLIVASGGNEFYGPDPHLAPRVYLNDGKGNFTKRNDAFDTLYVNASCVVASDFNGDGYADLFIGGRSVPYNYGEIPRSYLLQNDGTGHFTDVTAAVAPDLPNIGFVTRALWFDLDKDGQKDLLLCLEWGGIVAFMNHGGHFTKKVLTDKKGWWNFILPVDLDGDGNIDLIAGNLGLNSKLKASESQPVRMYYYDFDGNGKKDQVLTYYLGGHEVPFANMSELSKQMPGIKRKYSTAGDFARASLTDLFSSDKLAAADVFTADYFSNAVLINDGKLNFTVQPLPWQAQLAPYRDAVVVNANNDSLPDILLVGNYYENNIQMGRYDADFGTILVNKGKGAFTAETINGLPIKGQVRHISKIGMGKKDAYILARNNDSTMVIQFSDH